MTDQEIIERYRAIEAKMPKKVEDWTKATKCNNYDDAIDECTLAFSKLLLDRDEIANIVDKFFDAGWKDKAHGIAKAIIKAQKEKIKMNTDVNCEDCGGSSMESWYTRDETTKLKPLDEGNAKKLLKAISADWIIAKQDVGRELRVIPANEKDVIKAIQNFGQPDTTELVEALYKYIFKFGEINGGDAYTQAMQALAKFRGEK